MNDIKIEKNIPISTNGRKKNLYPFKDMEIGDSFFVECQKDKMTSRQAIILQSCRIGRYGTKKFTTRRVCGGIRCWRVE